MQIFGKVLMTLAIGLYTVVPPLVDLGTATHVFHAGWLPHARMHTVWLLGLSSSTGLVALWLLWLRKADPVFSRNLAGALGLCVYGAFFLAAATTAFYGGGLTDVEGIAAGPFGIDANLFTFTIATVLLLTGWRLAGREDATN